VHEGGLVGERPVRTVAPFAGPEGPVRSVEEGGEERPPRAACGRQGISPVDVLRRSEKRGSRVGGDDKAHEIVEHERAGLFVIYDLVQRRRSALHDDALDERCAQFRAFTPVIFVVLAQMGPKRFEDLVRDEPNFRDRRAHVEVAVVPATLAASDAMFPVLQVDEQDPVVSDHDGIDLAVLSRSDGDLEIRVGVPLPRQMPKLAQAVDLARMDALPLVSDLHAAAPYGPQRPIAFGRGR
jgi:hypothetical protein